MVPVGIFYHLLRDRQLATKSYISKRIFRNFFDYYRQEQRDSVIGWKAEPATEGLFIRCRGGERKPSSSAGLLIVSSGMFSAGGGSTKTTSKSNTFPVSMEEVQRHSHLLEYVLYVALFHLQKYRIHLDLKVSIPFLGCIAHRIFCYICHNFQVIKARAQTVDFESAGKFIVAQNL
ncbi:hypothetical protein CEXT_803571 [Caerostris extrusa]|uniref:Maturase K n=1 Tax=Caerostris extrusa TaxID=172846 RepID=A0AAV4PLZ0_CAEEX|nr:hypothetical protein CEXT_803571 [Caerostris extrusa]